MSAPALPGRAGSRARATLGLAASAALATSALLGCVELEYVPQAACGQLEIGMLARPIEDVVADPRTPPRTRQLLAGVADIKAFGEQHGLKPTPSYRRYAELGRPAAVWVVTASEPLRFVPKTWTFPVVGSVPYLGWFDRDHAALLAHDLADEGWDVDLREAGAYSTLGWFDDPVLSTMIPDGDEALGELANVVLHESMHATLYIPGQTPLNESIAGFVGDRLAERYLDERAGASSAQKAAYEAGEAEQLRRTGLLEAAYQTLAALYASSRPDVEKLAEKKRVLGDLALRLGRGRPVNNARLVHYRAYNSGRAELEALFTACGGEWPRMLAALRKLEGRTFAAAHIDAGEALLPLAAEGCSR